MSEELELQDSQEPDQDLDLEAEIDEQIALEEESQNEPPKPEGEDLAKKLAELENKNKQLYARLKKQEAKSPETAPDNSSAPVPDDLKQTVSTLALAEKKRQFGYEHGLSPEETDAVFKHDPNPSKETLTNPFVKGGLLAIRRRKRVQNATPSNSGSVPKIDGKSFTELSAEEQKAHYARQIAQSVQTRKK